MTDATEAPTTVEALLVSGALLTYSQVASFWHCSETAVRDAVRRGDLPAIRIPGSRVVRVRTADVLRLAGIDVDEGGHS
jgi:excisionase family DNA binding protein